MPKIKVKNIPDTTYKRICTNCIKCSRAYCFQFDVVKIPGGYVHYQSDVVELSEKDFPTNREWMESLSNEDLALFLRSYRCTDLHPKTIEEWLSKSCVYLMEKE